MVSSNAVDVHGLARHKMYQLARDLRAAAGRIGAVECRLALFAHQLGSAFGAVGGKDHRCAACRSLVDVDGHNLGNYLAALFDDDGVVVVKVERGDDVSVVERCAAHYGAGQLHRLHVCHRSDGTGAPDLIVDANQGAVRLLGLELVGDGPARVLGREPHPLLLAQTVHFEDDAVDVVGQMFALCGPMVDEVHYLGLAAAHLEVRRNLESPRARRLQIVGMAVGGQLVAQHVVEDAVERALRNHAAVLQLERAGCCVPWVCKGLFANVFALPVDLFEAGVRHYDFAAHLQTVGIVAAQPQRYALDCADVARRRV